MENSKELGLFTESEMNEIDNKNIKLEDSNTVTASAVAAGAAGGGAGAAGGAAGAAAGNN